MSHQKVSNSMEENEVVDLDKGEVVNPDSKEATTDKNIAQNFSRRDLLKLGISVPLIAVIENFLSACAKCPKEEEKKKEEAPKPPEMPKLGSILKEPQDEINQKFIKEWETAYKKGTADNMMLGISDKEIRELNENLTYGYQHLTEYLPYFELMFAKYDLPFDLLLVTLEESHFFNFTSRSGARGPYQLMPETAEDYGLKRWGSGLIDERCDPIKSNEVAAKFKKRLSNRFSCKKPNDTYLWTLAGYHGGEGYLGKFFDKCKPDFNYTAYTEMLNVAFEQAVQELNDADNQIQEKKEEIKHLKDKKAKDVQTVVLNKLREKYKKANAKWRTLAEKINFVPKFFGIRRVLFGTNGLAEQITPLSPIEFDEMHIDYNKDEINHTVKRGESLGIIANMYKVSQQDVKRWNNIKGTKVYENQQLKIYRFKKPIKIGEITHGQLWKETEFLKLNPSIQMPQKKENEISNIALPDGFDVRFEYGNGKGYLEQFEKRLSKQIKIKSVKAPQKSDIMKAFTQAESDRKNKSNADNSLNVIMNDIQSGRELAETLITRLEKISKEYEQEVKNGAHSEVYVFSQQELIVNQIAALKAQIEAEEKIGAKLQNIEEFIAKAETAYEKTEKNDLDALETIIKVLTKAMERTGEDRNRHKIIELMYTIQTDLENVLREEVSVIHERNKAKKPIPAEHIVQLTKSYELAQELTKSIGREVEDTNEIELIISLIQKQESMSE